MLMSKFIDLDPYNVWPDHDEAAEDADEGADDVEDDPGGDAGEDGEAGHDDQHHQHHAVHRAPDHPAQHHHVLLLPENTLMMQVFLRDV